MLKKLKRILPQSLFRRFLLIILLPNIIIQLVSVYVFYERHWSGVSKHMAFSIAGEIELIARGIEQTSGQSRQDFINLTQSSSLDLTFRFLPNSRIEESNFSQYYNFQDLLAELEARLPPRKYSVQQVKNYSSIKIEVQLDKDVVQILIPKRSIFTPTTYIFILWMICTAILFVAIAILFMRTQVRSITKLAEVAEKFGRGQDIPNFKASGATEVRQAAQAFLEMKKRINRHVEQRTEMLAGVSHDLKTPLTRMKLQLALMEKTEEIAELNQDILEMERMVQEYLDFAKGKERVVDANVNIADILSSIIAGYKHLNKKIDVTNHGVIKLHINSNSLRRAIINIIDNALKYGNKVKVSSRASEKYAYITVDDDGPGIEPEKYEEVFRPFFRLDSARNMDNGGSGLGLAIAKDIIVSYGGDINLDASPEGGLRVVIKLPL